MSATDIKRCQWCAGTALYEKYHDEEWGVPVYDDLQLFEMLNLEGAQAGLSWITVLNKRAHYRQVFDQFDPQKIAGYTAGKREKLLSDPGIIRNKLKVNAFIVNAQTYLEIQAAAERGDGPSFSAFLWAFVGGSPRKNSWSTLAEVPANTPESDAMSKALKSYGFKFTGSTICYAFMQATGMVNDHLLECFRYNDI